jgi:hypothetical protein
MSEDDRDPRYWSRTQFRYLRTLSATMQKRSERFREVHHEHRVELEAEALCHSREAGTCVEQRGRVCVVLGVRVGHEHIRTMHDAYRGFDQ